MNIPEIICKSCDSRMVPIGVEVFNFLKTVKFECPSCKKTFAYDGWGSILFFLFFGLVFPFGWVTQDWSDGKLWHQALMLLITIGVIVLAVKSLLEMIKRIRDNPYR